MNVAATITGVIYEIRNVERYSDFRKRVFLVQELNVKYPNTWQLEMWHDDVDILNLFQVGNIVECNVSVKGKLCEGKNSGKDFVINILKCNEISRC